MPRRSAPLIGRPASSLKSRTLDVSRAGYGTLDLAAGNFDRDGHDVTPIGDGGRAEDDDDVKIVHRANGGSKGARIVGHARLLRDLRRSRRKPLLENVERLGHRRRLQRRQHRRHHADAQRLERSNPDGAAARRHGLRELAAADRERDDFHRGDHVAGADRLERPERRQRDRLVDGIDRVDRRFVDADETRRLGQQVAATGEGSIQANMIGSDMFGEAKRRRVFLDVAGLQPCPDDRRDAGLLEGRDMLRAQQFAFLELHARSFDGVGEDHAFAGGHSHPTELHAACPDCTRATRFGCWRRAPIISARIETAISAGLTDPMSRPIGARIRVRSSSAKPAARIRSSRRACVFLEPRAPI